MPYFAYVLTNSESRIYIGQTDDVELRLVRHNAGLVRGTSAHGPRHVLFTEEFPSRGEAVKRERVLKGGQGRAHIRRLLNMASCPTAVNPP